MIALVVLFELVLISLLALYCVPVALFMLVWLAVDVIRKAVWR